MAVLETLVVTVGIAVAKSLLGLWLKDTPVAQSASESLLDVAKTQITDFVTARSTTREFERIGDRVAHNLVPLFSEYGLKDDSISSVANEVASTILSGQLSPKLFSTLNQDPIRIANHLRSKRPDATKLLNEKETSLYNRSIDLLAQYLVDLTSALPSYTASNLAEILGRLDQLIGVVDKLLDEKERTWQISQQENDDSAYWDFEQAYREYVTRNLDRVELYGVDARRESKRYQLSVSYISLSVASDKSSDEDELSVDKALSKQKRVVIIGEAGSGKTTLLRWLAVTSASGNLPKSMGEWRGSIPFYIELRQLKGELLLVSNFINHTAPELTEKLPKGWIESVFGSGRALLLIDGLDEVEPNKRQSVLDWIENIASSYGGIRLVFTSRSSAYQTGLVNISGLREYVLEPMQMRQIDQFIRNWHRAVFKNLPAEMKQETEGISQRLIYRLRNSPPLLRLSTNPLVCALICTLHFERFMHLPSGRKSIYEACCSMLLDRRDIEREIPLAHFPVLSYEEKRVLIDDLAYWMMRNGHVSIRKEDALQRMKVKLVNLQSQIDEKLADKVLDMLIERSGMLRQPTVDTIDFIHRTFQEYMTASAIAYENDWGYLIKNAKDDQWQETIILSGGFANRTQADSMIEDLLALKCKSTDERNYLNLLALSCLETIRELSPQVRKSVITELHQIVPPRSKESARSLIAAGDLVVPFLESKEGYSEAEASLCVQILGTIGTEQALVKLGSYANDLRAEVVRHFVSAIEYAKIEEIASAGVDKAILTGLSGRVVDKHFDVEAGALKVIELIPNSSIIPRELNEAINLKIRKYYDRFPTLSSVSTVFPRIEALTLDGFQLPYLDALGDFKRLNKLDMYLRAPIVDLVNEPGRPSRTIKSLRVKVQDSNWPRMDFLSEMMPEVVSIDLCDESDLSLDSAPIEDIALFTKVNRLSIASLSGNIADLSALSSLKNLMVLEIAIQDGIEVGNLIGIDELSQLKKIVFWSGERYIPKRLKEELATITDAEVVYNVRWSIEDW